MGGSSSASSTCQWNDPVDVKDQTMCVAPTPTPGPTGFNPRGVTYVGDIDERMSFEMKDAPQACVPTRAEKISYEKMRVLAWLVENRQKIIEAEIKFGVDRRAIAGAIAWEALENRRRLSMRAVGKGKIHLVDWIHMDSPDSDGPGFPALSDEYTVAKEVEDAGYLPKQSVLSRRKLLKTTDGAIMYIAAIMAAGADIAGKHGYDIRRNPVILTNFYQGNDLIKWTEHMANKKPGDPLRGGNTMDIWVDKNLQYLEDGVGTPDQR